jgi:D-serine deaminase-like pyridoxal phosphate-dependent protein
MVRQSANDWSRREALGMLGAAAAPVPYRHRDELPTPALVFEREVLQANLTKMAGHLKTSGRGFRPHAKTHKCAEIAKRCIAAGAVGACAAKISEAEALAAGGVKGLLVTTAVIGAPKIRQAVALARRQPDTIFCIDDAANAQQLNDAAKGMKLNVAIDLWVGRRTGIAPGDPAVALAEQVSRMPNLQLQGLQAYCGYAAHIQGFEKRSQGSREAMALAVETRHALEKNGIACRWLSGGSTGTYNIDSGIDGVTEIQPGSFLFMDIDYRRIGGRSGALYEDFQPSLFVLSTVVSRPQPKVAIVDAGIKAFATDRGYGPEAWQRPDLAYKFAGDEHGAVEMSGSELKVGDRLQFLVPHCDPTVNLYDTIYEVSGERVVAAWPVTARGKSQ